MVNLGEPACRRGNVGSSALAIMVYGALSRLCLTGAILSLKAPLL